jgi:hypothetical protein
LTLDAFCDDSTIVVIHWAFDRFQEDILKSKDREIRHLSDKLSEREQDAHNFDTDRHSLEVGSNLYSEARDQTPEMSIKISFSEPGTSDEAETIRSSFGEG